MRNDPLPDPNQTPSPLHPRYKELCDLLAQLLATEYVDLSKQAAELGKKDTEEPR